MILTCNSCEKRFVVPDQAITATGRTVQCGSCGSKWRQFPLEKQVSTIVSDKKIDTKKTPDIIKKPKPTKKGVKKTRDISLYSPEYLAKKHGISLEGEKINNSITNEKISFGFYNSLLLFIVIIITLSKSLHFFQDFIVNALPFTEFYLDYFFENIKNVFEIWRNLLSNY